MIAFSKGAEVVNLLEHPENQEHIKQAQEYTAIFAEIKGYYEGLYIANKETYVYTHSNPSAIGITCRSGDSLLEFQNTILKSDKVTNSGIMKSPSTGNMVMPMYYPCFVNGKCIGYVGSAVYAQQLMDSVVGLKMNGLLDCDYLLLNKKNKVYLYHDNQEKLNTEIDEKGLENLLDLIRSDESKTVGTYEYKNNENEKKLLAYVYIPERDWVFLIENNEATIYREVREIRLKIGIVCLCLVVIIGVAIMLICWILGKELKILKNTIVRLGNLDLTANEGLNKFLDRNDEIGQIANATSNLSEVLNKIIISLKRCNGELNESSKTLSKTSIELRKVISDNMGTTQILSNSIDTTNNAIVTVDEEFLNISEITENIKEKLEDGMTLSNQLMKNTKDLNQQVVGELDIAFRNIYDVKEQIKDAMTGLSAVEKISEFSNEILNITGRTNMLSLNASIEAARAGEAGRGFAVVANEINKLAVQSSKAVVKIQSIINESNHSIEKVKDCFLFIVKYMENDVTKNYSDFVGFSGEYQKDIEVLQDKMSIVSKQMEKLLQSVNQINENVKEVKQDVTSNKEGIKRIIDKAKMTSDISEEILKISEESKVITSDIEENIIQVCDKFLVE